MATPVGRPATPGIDFSDPYEVFYWYVLGLTLTHLLAREVLKRVGPFKQDAALVAHQVCSGLCIAHCAFWGVYYWFGEAGSVTDRLYGITEGALCIGKVNFAFQFYDTVSSLFVAKLRKMDMLVHHIVAMSLSYFLLRDWYVHYYAIFFMGISEVSSVPLVVVDVFKFFPDVAKRCSEVNNMLRYTFALLFLSIRVVYWPLVSLLFWADTIESVQAGTVHNMGIVCFFGVFNVVLTVLQWYWGYLIVNAGLKMLAGGKGSKENGRVKKD